MGWTGHKKLCSVFTPHIHLYNDDKLKKLILMIAYKHQFLYPDYMYIYNRQMH